MGLIAHGGILYGGGTDVEANPTGSATDTLTKVGIDGTVYEVTDADAIHTSDIGTANGVAELDANGLVPSSQLPSYVDDVLEYASVSAFPATGETGKIYVALDTNLTYRWSGSAYVEISPSLALGETSSTAYRGDRGKTAYDHATESGRSGAKSSALYKIGVTAQGHVASATAVAKADLTALGVADQNDVDAIEEDIEGFKTVTGKYITLNDAASLPAESYQINLSPVQDLNGYDSPWVGGAGKNKLPNMVEGVYSGNGLTITVDGKGVATFSGTANASGLAITIPLSESIEITQSMVDNGIYMHLHNSAENSNLSPSLENESVTQSISFVCSPSNRITTRFSNAVVGYTLSCIRFRVNSGVSISGTYSPEFKDNSNVSSYSPYSNICPIHGADEVGVRVCGKNLFDQDTVYGQYKQTDGSFRLTGINADSTKNSVPSALVGKQLTFSFYADLTKETSPTAVVAVTKVNGATTEGTRIENNTKGISSVTFTPTSTNDLFWVSYGSSGQNYFTLNNIQLEVGSTATDYEQYQSHSTTITLPSTVYGGSVDMGGSGESKYRFKTFDGTEDWSWYAPSNSVLLVNGLDYRKGAGETIWVPGLCNIVKTGSSTGLLDDYIQAATISGYTLQVVQIGQHFNIENSVDAWKAFLQENNMQLCYEMATPTDISVTPFPQTLLEGVNNVWAEMKENSVVIDNAEQSLSYQPQNIVGELRQEINAKPDSFAQLSDTSFSNLSNGQIPKWNSSTNKWENANESGGGGLPAWTKIWNYKSGEPSVIFPTDTAEVMLAIVRQGSNAKVFKASVVYPYIPDSQGNLEEYELSYFDFYAMVENSGFRTVFEFQSGTPPTAYDFEIWVR